MMSLETVEGLRAYLTEIIVRCQEDYACLWRETEQERHTGGPYAIVFQVKLAREYCAIVDYREWLDDEQGLQQWCQRIIRGRQRDQERAQRQQAEQEARLAAMTPAERDEYYAEQAQSKILLTGLITRDVQ